MHKTFKIISIISIFILISILGFYYLSQKSKNELRKQILVMDGMRINLSFKHAETIHSGIDSLYQSSDNIKLILYVDSTSCSTCFLNHLVTYYEINDSLRDHDAELLVLLHPRKNIVPEIKTRVRNGQYPFWCIIDSEGEFIRNNSTIPNNSTLHSFLLNKNNKIVFIGDPTNNKTLKKLFYTTLYNQQTNDSSISQ